MQTRTTVRTSYSAVGGWSLDKKIISIYMGNPDNSNHAELELPATPWEMVDAMDKLRLSEGQEPYWQVEDMGRYEFLAPHLDGYDLYQFNALQRSSVHSAMWMPWPLRVWCRWSLTICIRTTAVI